MGDVAYQKCIGHGCGAEFSVRESYFACPRCGDLLDVRYRWDKVGVPTRLAGFERRWAERGRPLSFSGVWRFRELLPFAPEADIITLGEGQTILQQADRVAPFAGMNPGQLYLQYEGLNPSGSFKDNGMTAAFTHAKMVGAKRAACASTGNTSASMAVYAAINRTISGLVFVGSGKIAYGKLAQALDYGVATLQLKGDFDACMARVQQVAAKFGIYLMNSLNPFRLEGQKTIMYRVLEALGWQAPDWIVVPGGNLGNSSAFGKAFIELQELGLIKKPPRIAIINAAGADTLYRVVNDEKLTWNGGRTDDARIKAFYDRMDAEGRRAKTTASAIEINRPVNLKKCLRALEATGGVVEKVTDQEILDAKAQVGRGGLGCEPASAASVAGTKKLVARGVIDPGERVVCILTGHCLKDPNITVNYHTRSDGELQELYKDYHVDRASFANRPVVVEDNMDAIVKVIEGLDQ
ncbi:MAG: threonine synthase [Phycisphaerae bacterium]|nr:threonine synthase [Phycisphaerae bacterium]